MADAKREIEKSKKMEMTRDSVKESQKPVYVMSDLYSDISSEEEQYEDVSSDEEEFQEMIVHDPIPEDRVDLLSISSSVMEDLMREEPTVSMDDILCGDRSGDVGGQEPAMDDYQDGNSLPTAEDSDVGTEENDGVSETTMVSLTMFKTETVRPDGTSEVVRNTVIAHSSNVDPNNLNFADIAMEIIREVPYHFHHRNVRVVNSNM
jgi:hypothetical protein